MRKCAYITLKDIAMQLNVSSVTVSKALRGHPDISISTTKKIKRLAQELGYVPNFFARSISSSQSKTIGIIIPNISDYFPINILESMYEIATQNGYELLLMSSQENPQSEQKHIETLLSMRVDGIIMSMTELIKDISLFQRVKQLGIPVTFISGDVYEDGFNKVLVDDIGGAFSAVEQAIKVGYKKIATMAGYQHTSAGKNRLIGYEAALKGHRIPVSKDWIIPCGYNDRDGYDGLKKLYDAKNLPECIFCFSFSAALGVYNAACELGLKIPEDIDIISFGTSNINQFLSPSITYVELPSAELGRTAMDLTIKSIKEKELFKSRIIILPTQLVLRETCVTSLEQVSTPDFTYISYERAYGQ